MWKDSAGKNFNLSAKQLISYTPNLTTNMGKPRNTKSAVEDVDMTMITMPETPARDLQPVKTTKAKALRSRIEGEFYTRFVEEHDRIPTQKELTNHVWAQELAARIPFESPFLKATVYHTVFGYPTRTAAQHVRYCVDILRVSNPAHRDEISGHVRSALEFRLELFGLFSGNFNTEHTTIVPWIGDIVECFLESTHSDEAEMLRERLSNDIKSRMAGYE